MEYGSTPTEQKMTTLLRNTPHTYGRGGHGGLSVIESPPPHARPTTCLASALGPCCLARWPGLGRVGGRTGAPALRVYIIYIIRINIV